jgi:hypothetical protein
MGSPSPACRNYPDLAGGEAARSDQDLPDLGRLLLGKVDSEEVITRTGGPAEQSPQSLPPRPRAELPPPKPRGTLGPVIR